MAEVAELRFLHLEAEDEIGGADVETLDETEEAFGTDVFLPAFSPSSIASSFGERHITPFDSGSESDYLEDQHTLALDLFDRRYDCGFDERDDTDTDPFAEALDSLGFGVYDVDEEMGSDYLGLGLGRGSQPDDENLEVEDSEWGEDGSSIGESSSPHGGGGGGYGEGSRIVGFDSDLDSEDEQIDAIIPASNGRDAQDWNSDDLGLPLCWDCLRFEEDRRDPNEEFEWEEVDGGLDEREVLDMAIDADVREEMQVDEELEEDDLMGVFEEAEERMVREAGDVDWEVLLAVNGVARMIPIEHDDDDSYPGDDHEDFIYTSEYEILFGQFAEQDSSIKGAPPAAKSVVEHLPSVVLMQDDVADNNTLCAVCKDDISLEESAKQLPCGHHYHGECILPWLRIRNTCPVCRYELPTDDPDYESWKARRARNGEALQLWGGF